MTRALAAFAAVVSVVALVVAVAAYRQANRTPRYGETAAAAYRAVRPGMTREDVRALVGSPNSVHDCIQSPSSASCSNAQHRDKECWQYTRPYQLRVCFGRGGTASSVGRYFGFTATEAPQDRLARGVRIFAAAGNRMTPAEVRRLFGPPDDVFRNNPRALCWRYASPHQVSMCWGPKRRQAWIASNTPLRATRG